MRIKLMLTLASIKMFYRQREAIIWTILLPLMIVILFSFVKFGGTGELRLDVVNQAGEHSAKLIGALKEVRTFAVRETSRDTAFAELMKGERDVVLVIPAAYAPGAAGVLSAYADVQAKPQEAQLAGLVLQRVLDELTLGEGGRNDRVLLQMEPVKSRNLTYIDFLLPGVLAMSIMQMGIFGVAFGFVGLKKRGILRRLWVTPINPNDFIIAQVITRVLVMLLQVGIMVAVGMLFLNLHFIGNMLSLFFAALLGAVIFLSLGFALAGISKTEDQVAPLANVISLPMMLLSGVFFDRANLPGIIHAITGLLPLTYLTDGMRSIAIEGASLIQIGPQLAGLAVWCVISCALAVFLFRWE